MILMNHCVNKNDYAPNGGGLQHCWLVVFSIVQHQSHPDYPSPASLGMFQQGILHKLHGSGVVQRFTLPHLADNQSMAPL